MFDLIAGTLKTQRRARLMPLVVSLGAHGFLLTLIVAGPLLYVTDSIPEVPTMMAFVAATTPPPPPPPPPAPVSQASATPPRPAPTTGFLAPVEAPRGIEPEALAATDEEGFLEGVEGGIAGGIPGGIVVGLVAAVPEPPPPPPPPPPVRKVVRIGGQVKAPDLLVRVTPVYPEFATMAGARGTVILEAVVDEEGRVLNVKVLRSVPLLDNAAIAALRQWRYSPLLLNGVPTRFELAVVFTFTPPEH